MKKRWYWTKKRRENYTRNMRDIEVTTAHLLVDRGVQPYSIQCYRAINDGKMYIDVFGVFDNGAEMAMRTPFHYDVSALATSTSAEPLSVAIEEAVTSMLSHSQRYY